MNNSDGRCNTARRNCSPEDIMAAADPCCSAITSPDGYNAEQLVFDQSYKDLINNFGYVIDYYLHTFNLSSANLLYGEEPTAVFYGPIPIKMYMELDNESISLQSFGFEAADDFTGYVHIKSFEETLSSRDFFIQTVSGDILPLSDYVDHLIPEEAGDYSIHQSSNWCKPAAFDPLGFGFTTEDDTQTFLPETMTEALTSLYDQSGGQYTILNKFIENNHELEPKSGDLVVIDALSYDCNVINNNLALTKIFDNNKFLILKKTFSKNIYLINKKLNNFDNIKYKKITTKNYLNIKQNIKNYMSMIK